MPDYRMTHMPDDDYETDDLQWLDVIAQEEMYAAGLIRKKAGDGRDDTDAEFGFDSEVRRGVRGSTGGNEKPHKGQHG